jgi:hypothetical protein
LMENLTLSQGKDARIIFEMSFCSTKGSTLCALLPETF